MLITRDIINKNIRFHNLRITKDGSATIESFGINDLYLLIDQYKNLLLTKGAEPNLSAIIGDNITLSQTALVFACAELGINIAIIDKTHNKISKTLNYAPAQISEKLKKMLPVTYLLCQSQAYASESIRIKSLSQIVTETIVSEQYNLDSTPNTVVLAKPDTVFLRSASSGSTGEPRVFEHTHHFMYELIQRNSKMFDGSVALIANLNHGSSPATYFLPALVSSKVTDFFHVQINGELLHAWDLVLAALAKTDVNFNHIMFPYTEHIERFLQNSPKLPKCTLYTLSYIKKDWVQYVKNSSIKDIISIFGSTETSGALLINQASDLDFDEKSYKKYDDFYELEINKNELVVHIPIYNRTTHTGDSFSLIDGKYVHNGRSHIFRINDLDIDFELYLSNLKDPNDADLVIDAINNHIHLAIWNENVDESLLHQINKTMQENSNGLHQIKRYEYLNKEDFMDGIKLDKQMLREHFKNKHSYD